MTDTKLRAMVVGVLLVQVLFYLAVLVVAVHILLFIGSMLMAVAPWLIAIAVGWYVGKKFLR